MTESSPEVAPPPSRVKVAVAAGAVMVLCLLAVLVLLDSSSQDPAGGPSVGQLAAGSSERPSATTAASLLQDSPTISATTAAGDDRWQLVLGAVLVFATLLVAILMLTGDRTPRAQGLLRFRRRGLSTVAHRAEAITDNVLARGGQKSIIGDALERAGLDLRSGEFIVVVCATALAACALAWFLVAPVGGLVAAAIVLVLSKVVVSLMAARLRQQFADQLAETLQLLTGSLRAGNGLSQALDTVARESEMPTSTEFRRLVVETRLGRDLSDALQALATRMRSRDMAWVVQAIDINREIGGNLTEILDTITTTIRDRGRLRRQVSALTAEGRLSALVIMVLPFAIGAFMGITNPDYIRVLFTNTVGWLMLAGGAALLALGGVWLHKLITPTF